MFAEIGDVHFDPMKHRRLVASCSLLGLLSITHEPVNRDSKTCKHVQHSGIWHLIASIEARLQRTSCPP
jgi:hypothetical protein